MRQYWSQYRLNLYELMSTTAHNDFIEIKLFPTCQSCSKSIDNKVYEINERCEFEGI